MTHELRAAGIRADRSFDNRSMKSQMKVADRSGARFAVIIGAEEAGVRRRSPCDLRHAGPESEPAQQSIPRRATRRLRALSDGEPVIAANVDCVRRPRAIGIRRRAHGDAVRMGGRRREHGEHLAFVDVRDHTGIVQCVVDGVGGSPVASTSCASAARSCRGPRAPSTRTSRPATVEIRDCTVEVLVRRRDAAVPDRRPRRPGRRERPACGTATSTSGATGCSATSESAPRSTARSGAPWSGKVSSRSRHRC